MVRIIQYSPKIDSSRQYFFSPYRPKFFHLGLNWKFHKSSGLFNFWKNIYVVCYGIPQMRRCSSVWFQNCNLNLQLRVFTLTWLHDCFQSLINQSGNLQVLRKIWSKKIFIFIFDLNLKKPKNLNGPLKLIYRNIQIQPCPSLPAYFFASRYQSKAFVFLGKLILKIVYFDACLKSLKFRTLYEL